MTREEIRAAALAAAVRSYDTGTTAAAIVRRAEQFAAYINSGTTPR